jgi:hypothetical protein
MLSRAGARALTFVFCAMTVAVPLSAQVPSSSPPKLWKGSALANASLFFGNNQQQVIGADGKLARVDSMFGFSAEFQTVYGEASLDTLPRAVTKRTWMATATVNFRPLAPVSSFVAATFESNLEKRVASRYSFGAGAKWNVRQTDATDATLSVSLSAEQTTPLDSTVHFDQERIARVSVLGKFQHSFDDRVQVTHSTSWQPSASGPQQYLVNSNTALRFKMNGTVSLSVTFADNYDSGAKSRGAHTNNDGQMLFGVRAGW